MKKYINLNGGKKSRNGEKYYEEFKTEFWRKPGKYYYFHLFHLFEF
jgi:hypothetical protein